MAAAASQWSVVTAMATAVAAVLSNAASAAALMSVRTSALARRRLWLRTTTALGLTGARRGPVRRGCSSAG